jgi:hypothetical protein
MSKTFPSKKIQALLLVPATLERSTKKVKLLLNGSHLEPQAMRPQCHHGDDDLE